MTWYAAGTVNVANGNAVVVGTGTDFVANVSPGDIFSLPGTAGIYEVLSIQSATQLTLARPWIGAAGAGQPYSIAPTQSFARDLANAAALLLTTFGTVRDGIGQGLIGDGTQAAPGIRFAADQDTGLRRVAANVLAIVTGGQDVMTLGSFVGIGTSAPGSKLHVNVAGTSPCYTSTGNDNGLTRIGVAQDGTGQVLAFAGRALTFGTDNLIGGQTEHARFDLTGNFLVGTTISTGWHRIVKAVGVNAPILTVGDGARNTVLVQSVGAEGWALSNAALYIGRDTATGRSLSAGGTVNASGADYAEYMTKCDGCGTIAAGEICGVTAQGKLTRTWGDAVAFVVKSTDPSYVGGDTWTQSLPPRPERAKGETDAAFASRQAAWDQQLEAERVKVDRIAFCGQAPVTMTGSFAAGDYVVAAANGSGIRAVAVSASLITFEQYRHRIGKVWKAIDATHAWVDVQHG